MWAIGPYQLLLLRLCENTRQQLLKAVGQDISLCGREVRAAGEVAGHDVSRVGKQRELVPSLLSPIYSAPDSCQGAAHIRGSFLGVKPF